MAFLQPKHLNKAERPDEYKAYQDKINKALNVPNPKDGTALDKAMFNYFQHSNQQNKNENLKAESSKIIQSLLRAEALNLGSLDQPSWKNLIEKALDNKDEKLIESLVKHDKFKGSVADQALRSQDENGNTLFHRAIVEKNSATLELLAKYAGDLVNMPNKKGYVPLYLAVNENEKRAVDKLLKSQVIDVNYRWDGVGDTALHGAAYRGYDEIAKTLVAVPGIDVNLRGNNNKTPLILAAGEARQKVVEVLIKVKGIDLYAKAKDANQEKTALGFARSSSETGYLGPEPNLSKPDREDQCKEVIKLLEKAESERPKPSRR